MFRILFALYFIGTSVLSTAQTIQTITFEEHISQPVGQLLLVTLGIDVSLDNGIDLYRVTYTTTGSDGAPDVASGLLMLPETITGPLPLLVYQHGTTSGRSDVPSNLAGGYQLGAIFAGKGMAVIAPDYLGMGTSRGFHPYIHARTEATAAADMITAVLGYFGDQNIEWNDQLFITGYSQGGHAAMALHEYLAVVNPGIYEVTASLPMSGPYDISGEMRALAFMDEPYGFPAYLVYSSRGIKEVDPEFYDTEASLFKTPYLPAIDEFITSGEGLFDMNESIIQTLIQNEGAAIPKHIFRDSILMAIEMDQNNRFNQALRENDVYDWAPEAPVLLLYCRTDDQIPFRNSLIADSVMNVNGAVNTTSIDVSGGLNLDHTDCIVPALNTGIPWILGFVDSTVPTIDLLSSDLVSVFPNPSSGRFQVRAEHRIQQVAIFNIQGQQVFTDEVKAFNFEVRLQNLSPGIYLSHLYTEDGLIVKKLVIQQ